MSDIGFTPAVGGRVSALVQRDGKIDLSIVAPEGPSAAVYLSSEELCSFALDVLARLPMESGQELGELIETRRVRVETLRRFGSKP